MTVSVVFTSLVIVAAERNNVTYLPSSNITATAEQHWGNFSVLMYPWLCAHPQFDVKELDWPAHAPDLNAPSSPFGTSWNVSQHQQDQTPPVSFQNLVQRPEPEECGLSWQHVNRRHVI